MKVGSLLAAALLVIGSSAFAAGEPKEVLACSVAAADGAQAQVTLTVGVVADAAADFMVLNIDDKGTAFRMFAQMEKGEMEQSLASGSLVSLLFEDGMQQDAGVIRNAGLIVVQRGATPEAFSGLLSARGNLYPLTCVLK